VSRRGIAGLLAPMGTVLAPPDAAADLAAKTRLYAAGSLKRALTELVEAFSSAHGGAVEATFGASGLLRARLEGEATGGVFASADLGNPRPLERAGKAGPVVLFARNRMCVLARPGLAGGHAGFGARCHDRPERQARHVDAGQRSLRRLCLGRVRQGGSAAAGKP
jgi:ABC-type molybdate transport system substrate-binding protein